MRFVVVEQGNRYRRIYYCFMGKKVVVLQCGRGTWCSCSALLNHSALWELQGRQSELVDDSKNGPKSLGLGFSTMMCVPQWKELLK